MKLSIFTKKAITVLTVLAIALSLITLPGGVSTVSVADEQAELEAQLKELQERQDELDDLIYETRKDISKEKENQEYIEEQIETTEEYIRTLDGLIEGYEGDIETLNGIIAEREVEIADTKLLIADQKAEIDENIELYKKRLRALYLSGNDSVASIILGSTDFFDMLMKIELVTRVARYNNSLIEDLVAMKETYEATQLDLENKVVDLENNKADVNAKIADVELLKADWNSQLDELEALYKESRATIKELEEEKEAYEENKEEIEKEAEKLEEEIQAIIREKARKEYMGDLPKGTFLWPCPGYYYISSGYGSRWGRLHKGIDIAGSGIKGEEITAANSGTVIKVVNDCKHNYGKSKSCGCGSGYGRYCIVDHGGGYTTLYAHATDIIVKEGQSVSTGDVLGYVGSTGYSTGYHLHFEIRIDGTAKDPEDEDKFTLIKK
ncbi:MAG: peptidoglycan DD-metalloendopeptidase family protein [Oscillospiraceae bacterium]|nr:peptidoglycan DD-metalloendopeptidase family protein [Oscillospiraceae bacterium]